MNNEIIYLSHFEFMEKIKEFEKRNTYTKDLGVYQGKMELKFYTQTGTVTYRARPLTKLERVLK